MEEYKFILISKDEFQLEPYQQVFDTFEDAKEYAINIFFYKQFDIMQVRPIQLFKFLRENE